MLNNNNRRTGKKSIEYKNGMKCRCLHKKSGRRRNEKGIYINFLSKGDWKTFFCHRAICCIVYESHYMTQHLQSLYWLKTDCFFKKLMKCPTYKFVMCLYTRWLFEVIEWVLKLIEERKEWRKIAACFPAMVGRLHHYSHLCVKQRI